MLGYLYSGDSGDARALEMGPADGHGPGAAAFGFFLLMDVNFMVPRGMSSGARTGDD